MLHLELSRIAAEVSPITESLSPYLPLLGVVFGGIVVGLFGLWNRRKGNMETRAPDVNEIWQQQAKDSHDLDMERRWRRRLENFSHDLLGVYRSLARRVMADGFVLTKREQSFMENDPPTAETPIIKETKS